MTSRCLIVNGDDFGISEEVNKAIILAWRVGILTSCSLMTGGRAFDDAVRLARENPGLAVGIHATCVDGTSVLPPGKIPNLVDGSGNFPSDPALAGLKYFFCKAARKELAREFEAQFEKFHASGLRCSHIDGHCHMHVNPAVFDPLVALGEKYGVRRMRVPDDDFSASRPFLLGTSAKAGYALVFRLLSARMKSKLRERGFRFPVRVYGNLLSGAMTGDYVLSILEKLPIGISEVYLHPAFPPDSDPPNVKEFQLMTELRILLDPQIRSKMNRLGITPAAYPDLDRF